MAHAAGHAGRRRNASSGTGNAGMTPARGSTGTAGVASAAAPARGLAPTTAPAPAVAPATAVICEGDLAGRQMPVNQCDGGSGQRRTNDRRSHEPLQSLW